MNKKSINNFKDSFDCLNSSEQRQRLHGDSLITISHADFSTASFRDIEWDNFRFENCYFGGQYKIMLTKISNCIFEKCSFSGILDFGVMLNTKFIHCDGSGEFYLLGNKNSKNVIFEQCKFSGPTGSNDTAGIGAGEASFLDCTLTKADLFGDSFLLIRNCNCTSVDISQSKEFPNRLLRIEDSKFIGETFFQPSDFSNVTIKQCKFEKTSFRQASIDNELVIENCTFKSIDLYVEYAKQVTMRNSTVYGDGRNILSLYTGAISHVVIDSCEFGSYGEENIIAGGIDPDDEAKTSKVNKTIEIRNSAIPILSSVYVNSPSYTLEGCTIDAADFNHSRFGSFTIKNTKINRSINFTATQAKVQDITGLYGGGLSLAQVEGSNIKLPR